MPTHPPLPRQGSKKNATRSFEKVSFGRIDSAKPSGLKLLSTDEVERDSLKKTDIVIVIIGTTGTGKSTFVEKASGHKAGVGHELESFTKKITAYRITFQNSPKKVVLVDTPGFDSTSMSDRDVFEHIAKWLSSTSKNAKNAIALSGILYMHRISDNRMARTPIRNLELLEKLCGEDALRKVILVTTMWEVKGGESFDLYVERENELKQEYWQNMIENGSRVKRFMNVQESAWDILNLLTEPKAKKRDTLIQRELLTQSRTFADSSLGRAIQAPVTEVVVKRRNVISRLTKELGGTTQTDIVKALGHELRKLGEQQDNMIMLPDQMYPRFRNSRKGASRFSRFHCRSLLLEIANNHEARKALCTLRDNEAQAMVNYMNLEIRDVDIFADGNGRQLCSLFCKFAKSARTFPELFQLSGVRWDKKSTRRLGGFAVVYKGACNSSGQAVAVKLVKDVGLEMLRLHVKELTLWAHLWHPNILPFYGVFRGGSENEMICLVSPWMDNGNLHEYSKQCSQPERFHLLFDAVKGLLYLHKMDIIHGDLKGGNILVSKDGKALIADFGLSRIESTETKMLTVNVDTRSTAVSAASIRWTAPEVLESNEGSELESAIDDLGRASKASDVWAFGSVVYEIMSRRLPYDTYAMEVQVMYAILNHTLPERPRGNSQSDEIPEGSIAWRIIQRCWKLDPAQRPTIHDVHSFFISAFESDRELLDERSDPADDPSGTPPSCRFWEDTKMKSQVRIDFSEIYHLLLEAWESSITRGR